MTSMVSKDSFNSTKAVGNALCEFGNTLPTDPTDLSSCSYHLSSSAEKNFNYNTPTIVYNLLS